MSTFLKSWGGCTAQPESITTPRSEEELDLSTRYLAIGSQRSYGDSGLIEEGRAIRMTGYDQIISFDSNTGVMHCQAGITMQALINYALPKGWIPPVLPGTQFVTIGGAIANDIHGKNHHRQGSFGNHVIHFKLARSDGLFICSPTENVELYRATIGGLGLTGVVLEVAFRMIAVESNMIARDRATFSGVAEMIELLREADTTHTYTVAWLDLSGTQNKDFTGYVDRGNHSATTSRKTFKKLPRFAWDVPFTPPVSLINSFTVRVFNFLYRWSAQKNCGTEEVPLDRFFFPLDGLRSWNRLYGRKGFLQFQAFIPSKLTIRLQRHILLKLLNVIQENSLGTPLVVIKNFGSMVSPGLLSYPRAGLNIALDMMPGEVAKNAYTEMADIVSGCGGAIYPAKDALMKPENFRKAYPNLDVFRRHVDPNVTSLFWNRMQSQ